MIPRNILFLSCNTSRRLFLPGLGKKTRIHSGFWINQPALRRHATMSDPQTYKFNHSMIRVKDPEASKKFYGLFGMKQIDTMDNSDAGFTLYFLAFDGSNAINKGKARWDREGILELTHNHGTEKDPNFKANNGNEDPGKGFGHICITVDNIQAACARLEKEGVKFHKRLQDGNMKFLAFALDPDGYWIEIVGKNDFEKTEGVTETDVGQYSLNHTMLRIKDPEVSLEFYQKVLGMTLVLTREMPDSKFNLYFLCYKQHDGKVQPDPESLFHREGVLELTWNYGTEKDPDFKYHSGNEEPQGFGHICLSVDDLDAACKRFTDLGAKFKKRPEDGRMRNIAFMYDPDGYWIELVAKENKEA